MNAKKLTFRIYSVTYNDDNPMIIFISFDIDMAPSVY